MVEGVLKFITFRGQCLLVSMRRDVNWGRDVNTRARKLPGDLK